MYRKWWKIGDDIFSVYVCALCSEEKKYEWLLIWLVTEKKNVYQSDF